MKYTTIPAGYRLTVNSWENDLDAGSTQIVAGLAKNIVKYYLEICSLLESEKHGNMFEPSDTEIQALKDDLIKIIKKYSTCVDEAYDVICKMEEEEESVFDSIEEYFIAIHFQLFGNSSEFYTRVFDSFKVEYFPEEILIQDVTEEFK